MRVLFWGTSSFAVPALRALSEEGHDVVGVVTQPDRPAGRGRSVAQSPVKEVAGEEGLLVLQPQRPRGEAFEAEIRSLKPEISVVVAYGHILRPEILSIPRYGSVNIHASLLPELRGAAPIHWAIIRGHQRTGVTIMRVDEGLDSGPILMQVAEPIGEEETASELTMRLSELGAESLLESLAFLEAGAAEARVQDHSLATYAPKLDRETARLDWTRPADEVARWIRGLDAVPGAWSTREAGEAVKFFRPTLESGAGDPGLVLEAHPSRGILVAAGGKALRIAEVQPTGKRRMASAEWVRGRGVAAGDHFR
jgi:methionyl-tRNA formyltransferase